MLRKAIFIFIIFFLIGVAYLFRYQLFPKYSPEPYGVLTLIEDQITGRNIDQFFEEFHSKFMIYTGLKKIVMVSYLSECAG